MMATSAMWAGVMVVSTACVEQLEQVLLESVQLPTSGCDGSHLQISLACNLPLPHSDKFFPSCDIRHRYLRPLASKIWDSQAWFTSLSGPTSPLVFLDLGELPNGSDL